MILDRFPAVSRYLLRRDYKRLTRTNQRKLLKFARSVAADNARRRDTGPLRTKGATGPLS
ncbi:MAG: hypothetical protein GTO41_00340 [Burkholderiales bacterium]|nr:hypothetical protein [Burkholderiales bacterium]